MKSTATLAVVLILAAMAPAADHLDAPAVSADGRLDINDLYAFQSPDNPDNTVIVLTVNPAAGVLSPTTFNPAGTYQINIDNDADLTADITFDITFGAPRRGSTSQSFFVRRNGVLIARGRTERDARIRRGGGTATAGLFEDPFFFDLNGFSQDPTEINFTGEDFFTGLDVAAIVIEVPSSTLTDGDPNIGVWARTLIDGEQFDRMGRPGINTILIPSGRKNLFNAGSLETDSDTFFDDVATLVEGYSGDPDLGEMLAMILLPDVLTFDTSNAAGFLNGRRLEDDVIDAALDLVTGGALDTDGVDENDAEFLDVFPYLAAANQD